ncbi:MAG TPA: NAD+ synthase [Candidatus Acidoferrales bacterium]|nr:NAD+ synthase [Candidatus Acidoferrales bacterium]
MKIALAQIDTTVGDFRGNARKIAEFAERARSQGAALVLFPELSVCGYPPRDFVERPDFVRRNRETAEQLAREISGIDVVIGLVMPAKGATGKSVMNSAALLRGGRIAFVQSKRLLPTYDVFDEMRNFAPAEKQELFCLAGTSAALTICEDAWNDKSFWDRRLYSPDPVEDLVVAGGQILLNISASPFHVGKPELRERMLAAIAKRHQLPVAMCNQVGGNDSLVFDGASVVIAPDGRVIARARSFEEDIICFDTESLRGDLHEPVTGEEASAFAALVLGTRDYVHKCGFRKAIIGLSGGIDSALTAAVAVHALGAENVIGVGMPSQYSSEGSVSDARQLAQNLGIRFEIVAIREIFESFRHQLAPVFSGLKEDVTEENIQARIRGTILMALSNKFGALVLTTGNKSELGVGYCTLYGDMVGGLAVISDVPKTLVYRISRYLNREREVIPDATLTKEPSAELRPNQKDSDSLPDYAVLDAILEEYVEDMKSVDEIAEKHGFSPDLVRSVIRMIDRNEYKRQQAAPGIKISEKAFGVGRRFPIAARHEL